MHRYVLVRRVGCRGDEIDIASGVDYCRACAHGDVEYVFIIDEWFARQETIDDILSATTLYVVFRRRPGSRVKLEDVAACIMGVGVAWRRSASTVVFLDEDAGIVGIEGWEVSPRFAEMLVDDLDSRIERLGDVDIVSELLYPKRKRRYHIEVYGRDFRMEDEFYRVTQVLPWWDHVDSRFSRIYPMMINGVPHLAILNVEELEVQSYVALKMLERALPVAYLAGLDVSSEVGVFRLTRRMWRTGRVIEVDVEANSVAGAAWQGIMEFYRATH